MVSKFLAFHKFSDGLDPFSVGAEQDFRHRIKSSPVSTGLDPHLNADFLIAGGELRHHISGSGEAGEGDLNTRPCGFARFKEDELVLVADDQGNLAGHDLETRKARSLVKAVRRRSQSRQ